MLTRKLILFAEIIGASQIAILVTVIPLANFFLGIILLIFAGKKYFLAFAGVSTLQIAPQLIPAEYVQYQGLMLALNKNIYGLATSHWINPTVGQAIVAQTHTFLLIQIAIGAFFAIWLWAFAIWYVKKKLTKILVPRVRPFKN